MVLTGARRADGEPRRSIPGNKVASGLCHWSSEGRADGREDNQCRGELHNWNDCTKICGFGLNLGMEEWVKLFVADAGKQSRNLILFIGK